MNPCSSNPDVFYKLVAKSLHEKVHILTRGYESWEKALVAIKIPIKDAIKEAQNYERRKSCAQTAIKYGLAAGVLLFTGLKAFSSKAISEKTLRLKI